MTRSLRRILTFTFGLMLVSAASSGQDFDPKGRRKPGGKPTSGKPAGVGAKPSGGMKPSGGTKAGTKPVGGTTGTNPAGGPDTPTGPVKPTTSPTVLIERYSRVVLAQPGSPFPLQRLAQLYRDRDGNIAQLVKDFEARTATDADSYPAWIALGGIYKIDGRGDDAVKAYEKAIAQKPKEPAALLALARLLQDRADLAGAKVRYEQALEAQTNASDREQTLRSLSSLLLDQKDYDGAKQVHEKLVTIAKGSLFVRSEFARELLSRGEYSRAEAEYAALLPLAQGDNRVLAPALKDLGRAQVKGGKSAEALTTLKRALAAAGREAGVRSEVYELIAEVHRKEQTLPTLIAELEREGTNDFQRLQLLGTLYEETGDGSRALTTYKKALALNPKHLDLRLKVVRILQSQGEIDQAIAEYESLVRAAPNNPTFVFELADAILQRGDRARALRLLTEVEARSGNDEEILSRLADFYGRIGESEKSVAALTRLSQLNTNDPSHIVDLGSRYFQDGKTQLAIQTWRRMLTVIAPRARAVSALGDVFMEHDMNDEAIALFKEAIALDRENPVYKKQLAAAFERAKEYAEAKNLWEQVAKKAKDSDDRLLAREARTRLISIWGFEKSLPAQLVALKARFNATPPDLEAGRTLAEVEIRLKHVAEAEAAMRRVITLAPSDTETYLALERLLVQGSKFAEAIAVLERLIAADPKRARDTYQRMADHAGRINRDDDAIRYAAKASELNPDDAEGHKRLGDMYAMRQDRERAIAAYKSAIAKNDRLFTAYFKLADLLLAKGETTEADALFRRVLRTAPDDELVGQAARQSLQLHLGSGTLEELERDLLPLTVANPTRTVFRRVLVDLYGSLTFALVKRARIKGGDGEARKLAEIGARAVKPLLDALADADVAQQRIAIDVLSQVANRNTGLSLLAYATGSAEPSLRARAMLACANLKEVSLLPKYQEVLFPKESEAGASADQVSLAAVYAVAKLRTPRAASLLTRVLQEGTPEMQTFAALGLGAMRDRASRSALVAMTKTPSRGALLRAASILSLGAMGGEDATALALEMAKSGRPVARRAAILSLAMTEAGLKNPKTPEASASSLFMASKLSDETDAAAVRVLAASASGQALNVDLLPAYEQGVSLEAYILTIGADAAPLAAREAALVQYEPLIRGAAGLAARTSPERALALMDAFGERTGAFVPFIQTSEEASVSGKAREVVLRISTSLEETFAEMTRNPDSAIRARALGFMARGTSETATSSLRAALTSRDELATRAALAAVGSAHGPFSVASEVEALATSHPTWSVRIIAVQALGHLLRSPSRNGNGDGRALAKVALGDAYPVVRERALRELHMTQPDLARVTADTILKQPEKDDALHLREVARSFLAGKP